IFAACLGMAKLLFWLLDRAGLIRDRSRRVLHSPL
ncbi:MAG: WzyE family oligosaccharide polymerase, partial [Pantoea agglomerans]